jgi:hypothetical protein
MCLQYVADNVEQNIRTIDELDTFHGMGIIIAMITPGTCNLKPVLRITLTAKDVAAVGRIDVKYFKPKDNFEIRLRFAPLPQFTSEDQSANIDLFVANVLVITPSWNGFMQKVQRGAHPGLSAVVCMPMIDMKPSDESCIYSTMNFVASEAKRYDATPVLTFDQPLLIGGKLLRYRMKTATVF